LWRAPDTDDPTKNWAYHAAKLIQIIDAFTRAYWLYKLKKPTIRVGTRRDDHFEAFFWFDEASFKKGAECLFVLSFLVNSNGIQVLAIRKEANPREMKDSELRISNEAPNAREKDAIRRNQQQKPSLLLQATHAIHKRITDKELVPCLGRSDTMVMFQEAGKENASRMVRELGEMTLGGEVSGAGNLVSATSRGATAADDDSKIQMISEPVVTAGHGPPPFAFPPFLARCPGMQVIAVTGIPVGDMLQPAHRAP
jgi:hypothetical protein